MPLSYKRNLKAKATRFKKGNKCAATHPLQKADCAVDCQESEVEPPIKITRPTKQEYSDACQISAGDESSTSKFTCPTRLRPAKESFEIHNSNCDPASNEENVIVNFEKLSSLLADFIHQCEKPSPVVKLLNRKGLCITAQSHCLNCGYISTPCELFTRIKKKRGPTAGSLNDALALSVLKTKMGLSDVRYFLSCLNVQPPAGSCLHRKICAAADKMVQLNTESMTDNQVYVKKVMEMAGRTAAVNVETDLSFNNRPQAGYEAGTQSFCPMVEQDTSKKLVLSMATANKLCSKKSCDHKNKCSKNFSSAESISSSETKLVRENFDSINKRGLLKIKSVTTDASAQIDKSLRNYSQETKCDIAHFTCFVHKLRNVQKHIRYTRLTSKLPGFDKEIYSLRLSTAVRARVRSELVNIKRYFKSTPLFVSHAQPAIRNIFPCFSGNHSNCRKYSMVCSAHLDSYSTNFLPYNKHIQLNRIDMLQLQAVLQSDFSQENLEKISRLSTTNRSESLHHRVFTYAPKCTIWSRNFTSLCHSAVHSSTLGTGKSSLFLAKKVGIRYKSTDPFFKEMIKLDTRNKYHLQRKCSREYKLARHLARKRKSSQKMKDNSLYTTATASVSTEHSYGINMNK